MIAESSSAQQLSTHDVNDVLDQLTKTRLLEMCIRICPVLLLSSGGGKAPWFLQQLADVHAALWVSVVYVARLTCSWVCFAKLAVLH